MDGLILNKTCIWQIRKTEVICDIIVLCENSFIGPKVVSYVGIENLFWICDEIDMNGIQTPLKSPHSFWLSQFYELLSLTHGVGNIKLLAVANLENWERNITVEKFLFYMQLNQAIHSAISNKKTRTRPTKITTRQVPLAADVWRLVLMDLMPHSDKVLKVFL
jgi:hypothetical protein